MDTYVGLMILVSIRLYKYKKDITNFIKITPSIEKWQYDMWSELFRICARVYQVIDHIISHSPSTAPLTSSLKDIDPEL